VGESRVADRPLTNVVALHKRILEWQAEHPTITWVGWGIVWAIVLLALFWPRTAH
jgi:hypothetical protein